MQLLIELGHLKFALVLVQVQLVADLLLMKILVVEKELAVVVVVEQMAEALE